MAHFDSVTRWAWPFVLLHVVAINYICKFKFFLQKFNLKVAPSPTDSSIIFLSFPNLNQSTLMTQMILVFHFKWRFPSDTCFEKQQLIAHFCHGLTALECFQRLLKAVNLYICARSASWLLSHDARSLGCGGPAESQELLDLHQLNSSFTSCCKACCSVVRGNFIGAQRRMFSVEWVETTKT